MEDNTPKVTSFSDFFRNASRQEKERVFLDVAKEATDKQRELIARNQWESLINEIAMQTDEKDKKAFAALLAKKAREYRFSETDLHYLLKKRQDPKVRNYSAFVRWAFHLTKGHRH